jgi:hypothetical protein
MKGVGGLEGQELDELSRLRAFPSVVRKGTPVHVNLKSAEESNLQITASRRRIVRELAHGRRMIPADRATHGC